MLTNRICAVKSIGLGKVEREAVVRITTEKEILKACRHPHITQLYEALHDEVNGQELLFMELCIGGDLLTYLRKRRRLRQAPVWATEWQNNNRAFDKDHSKLVSNSRSYAQLRDRRQL